MLSSAKIGTRSHRYYTAQVACSPLEYYLGIGDERGRWHGRGVEALGLDAGAEVGEPQLEALFGRALHPVTGQRLGRAWRVDGVTGFDLTFSAPKSVSALWALGNPAIAGQVREAHRAAVAAALSYLDAHASWSRRGMDGTEQIATAGLAAALFEHRTSRCADPQLHTHALVINKVLCADGRWRTLDATELFHHKKSAGTIYQAALRSELHATLGVVFEVPNAHGQAEIAGVPRDLLTLWSKRTAQIEPEAAAKIAELESRLGRSLTGAERAAVTKTAVLKTRPAKFGTPSPTTLHDGWAGEATRAGHDPDRILAAVRDAAEHHLSPAVDPDAVAGAALNAASGLRSTFSRADVATQVAARFPVDARGAAGVLATVEDLTDHALGLDTAVPVGSQAHGVTPRASDARWAGAEVLAAEARVLSLAARGRGGGYGQVPSQALAGELAGAAGLDESQQAAVRRLVGGGDFLSVLTAPAGAGKTRTLGVAADAWASAGYRVIGLAPSARAAAELAAATGGPADTLAKWLHNHTRRGLIPPQQRARTVLDAATVVIVDEASMANTHDLDVLITAAARRAAKVVLVGDPAQIGVINGPGGMLAALAAAGHGLDLTGVHRFTHAWEREASLGLRAGDPAVLAAYHAAGRLHPCPDGDAALDAVYVHWGSARAAGVEALMMARTRADVDALNERARAAAQASGEVAGPSLRFGERDWQAGDLLRTRRNDRRLLVGEAGWEVAGELAGQGHVRNGDRYRVLTVRQDGLLVEDLTGRGRVLLPGAYVAAHAEYGWASTVDAAQGATVEIGILLARPGLDREHLYVGLTRGRAANHAYIAPDPAGTDDEHHGSRIRSAATPIAGATGGVGKGPAAAAGLDQANREVLLAALASTGAQDAAHTVRETARARVAAEQRRALEAARAAQARDGAGPVLPAEHAATATRLEHCRDQLAQLRRNEHDQREQLRRAEAELARTSRWSRARRHDFTDQIATGRSQLSTTLAAQQRLGIEVDDLARQVDAQTRQLHTHQRQAAQGQAGQDQSDQRTRTGVLRQPRPEQGETLLSPARPEAAADALARAAAHAAARAVAHADTPRPLTRREAEERHRTAHPRRTRPGYGGAHRDDGPSISR